MYVFGNFGSAALHVSVSGICERLEKLHLTLRYEALLYIYCLSYCLISTREIVQGLKNLIKRIKEICMLLHWFRKI